MGKFTGAPYWPLWVLFGALVGVTLGGLHLPSGLDTVQAWVGSQGILPLLVSTVTLGGVVVAFRNYNTNTRETERRRQDERESRRFDQLQRATDLLESNKMTSQVSAIAILSELAKKNTSELGNTIQSILLGYIIDQSSDDVDRITKCIKEKQEIGTINASLKPVVLAFSALNAFYMNISDVIYAYGVFFNHMTLRGKFPAASFVNTFAFRSEISGEFERCRFDFYYGHDLSFSDAKIEDAIIYIRQNGEDQVDFVGCDLSRSVIRVIGRAVYFDRCNLDGAEILADEVEAVGCWYDQTKPTLFSLAAERPAITLPAARKGTWSISANGVNIFTPVKGARMSTIIAIDPPPDKRGNPLERPER